MASLFPLTPYPALRPTCWSIAYPALPYPPLRLKHIYDTAKSIQCQCTTLPFEVFNLSGVTVQLARVDCSVRNGQGVQLGRDIHFCKSHEGTVLVAIDTFQLVRGSESTNSYADDYREMRALKSLADELQISLLLVHHLRKQGDSDPLNKLSGTTGITGATDAIFVLDKSKRKSDGATLCCTGRDIEYREIELRFDKEECVWEMQCDSLDRPEMLLPESMQRLAEFTKAVGEFDGTNKDLTEWYNEFTSSDLSAKALKQQMNRYRFQLEDVGIFFESRRSNGQRFVKIWFSSVDKNESATVTQSDVSDATKGVCQTCDTCVPCVPAECMTVA